MTKSTRDILSIIFIGIVILAGVIIGPLVMMWSLNTLFPVLAIPYNFYTWLATAFINATMYLRAKQS